jgi:LAO/AO transport system kinase
MTAIADGHRVGVLTVDPSSTLSQGSILGDKSRMNQLSVSPNAFIRSSAAGKVLGGLGRRSMEMMTLLAAAGYDLIFLETVGVGQSEHTAWKLTDGFILVIQPGAGDELQGIKRGITELADIVIVNKADRELATLAKLAKAQYDTALHLFSSIREGWIPKVVTCSAAEGHGIEGIWQVLRLYKEHLQHTITLSDLRHQQQRDWLTWSVSLTAQRLVLEHPVILQKIEAAEKSIDQTGTSVYGQEFEIENAMNEIIYADAVSKSKS